MSAVIYNAVCARCGDHTGYSHKPIDGDFVCSPCLAGKKTQAKSRPARAKLVNDFIPDGRSGLYIYAVVIKQHPDKVKIGMTRKWKNRRIAYANWDLSPGDAILEERIFRISEDFIDLERLEAHILSTFKAPRAFGAEWFRESIDEACRHIDRIMCANDISYDLA